MLDGPGLELHPRFAPNVVTTLGRLAGRTVGVIANNPLRLGGCLDSASAEKAARFVRMCDAFGIPLVVLVDVPGYLPGVGQEWDGVVRRGAKLLHAFAEAVVPRVTLVTRKSYGGAYIAMNARSLGATAVFAWPGRRGRRHGRQGRRRHPAPQEAGRRPAGEREALHAQLAEEHERIAGGVNRALQIGVVDEVVEPRADQAPAGRGARRRPARPRRARQHPALDRGTTGARHRRGAWPHALDARRAPLHGGTPAQIGQGARDRSKWSSGRRFPDGARTTGLRLRRLRESGPECRVRIVTLLRRPGAAR